jgi:hypothetical protein
MQSGLAVPEPKLEQGNYQIWSSGAKIDMDDGLRVYTVRVKNLYLRICFVLLCVSRGLVHGSRVMVIFGNIVIYLSVWPKVWELWWQHRPWRDGTTDGDSLLICLNWWKMKLIFLIFCCQTQRNNGYHSGFALMKPPASISVWIPVPFRGFSWFSSILDRYLEYHRSQLLLQSLEIIIILSS